MIWDDVITVSVLGKTQSGSEPHVCTLNFFIHPVLETAANPESPMLPQSWSQWLTKLHSTRETAISLPRVAIVSPKTTVMVRIRISPSLIAIVERHRIGIHVPCRHDQDRRKLAGDTDTLVGWCIGCDDIPYFVLESDPLSATHRSSDVQSSCLRKAALVNTGGLISKSCSLELGRPI